MRTYTSPQDAQLPKTASLQPRWWAAAAALLWLLPARASAWTDTQVVSVSARVDARTARAHVVLDLGLRVREGWLSRFELLDLGPQLELDPTAPLQLVDSDGTSFTPTVQGLPGNGLVLLFPDKRSAPKRGDYNLQLTWRTQLAEAGEGEQHWSLPRWPERVPNVQLQVLAPLGARPSPALVREHGGVDYRDLPKERMTVLRYVRPELPRTARFEAAWSLPASAQRGPSAAASRQTLAVRPLACWLGVCLSVLWLLTWSLRARCSQERLDSHAAAHIQWRGVAGAIGCGLSVALFDALPLWAAGLGVLSCLWACEPLQQSAARVAYAGPSSQPSAFLNVRTPIGAAVALLLCLLLCWLRPLAPGTIACGACLAAVLLLSGAPREAPQALSSSSSSDRRPPCPGL